MLAREGGNISRTARALGLSRLGLRKKLRRYKLDARPPRR
jgi:DNA-binding protein Fis